MDLARHRAGVVDGADRTVQVDRDGVPGVGTGRGQGQEQLTRVHHAMSLGAGVGGKVGIDGEVHGACFTRLQVDTCVADEAPNGPAHPGEGVTEVELDDFRAGGATGVADGASDPDGTVGGCGGRYVVLQGFAVDPGVFPG